MMKTFKLTAKKILSSDIKLSLHALDNLSTLNLFNTIEKTSKHILITDENVDILYAKKIIEQIEANGYNVLKLIIPPYDKSKNLQEYSRLADECLNYGFDKHSVIFSLGGGVVNNIAGFLASTLYRGIGLIHFPTSMLAQVDAAIDFKQAVNHNQGKNLLGSYYPASQIIIDPTVLKTLDRRFIVDGLSESIKHALCQDRPFYDFLEKNVENLDDENILLEIIQRSIELKLELMNDDLEDDFDETIKQYGHALGHAIEHLSNGEIYHGEAIAIGMCVSSEIALLLGLSDERTRDLHYSIFDKYSLPTVVPKKYSFDNIWNKMKYDKHSLNGKVYTGILQSVGSMALTKSGEYGHYIEEDLLRQAIDKNQQRIKK
ncbi:MAG: iron-containing alcohol dehydrogenase [Sulfurovum sp.]|nr:iron-containing alcohol dehydrogenase [Sulfurovum sp.]